MWPFKQKPKGPQYSEGERRRMGLEGWRPFAACQLGDADQLPSYEQVNAAWEADLCIERVMGSAEAMPMGGK